MPARFDYRTCEPFRAWNRVEPRVRQEEFDRALRCEIHDPLWMLTRQWQFGEFKGEDTGSAIFARALVRSSRLTRYRADGHSAQPYSDELPLETLVESEQQRPDFRIRLQAGRRWTTILADVGDSYNAVLSGRQAFVAADYRDALIERFGFSLPEEPSPSRQSNDHSADIQVSKLRTNHRLALLVIALSGRAIDGLAIYDAVQDNSAIASTWSLHPDHRQLLEQAADLYKGWADRKLARATSATTAWKPNQLEYGFTCAAPDTADEGSTFLVSDEYYQGHLDWYSFDSTKLSDVTSGLANTPPADAVDVRSDEVVTFIPTPAAFAGMPNARWWEFEDGAVDLGNISANTTDLAKVVLTEFALMYGNDWYVLPYPVRVGSICEIPGIVVTDVFGQQTLVGPASQGGADDWSGWGLFNLSGRDPHDAPDTRLFLPPAVVRVLESEPVEEVLFVRDEMANLVWAIETKIPDLLSRSLDGHAAAMALTEFWLDLQGIDPDAEPELHEAATFKYTLANTLPENWIPFIPVHVPDGTNRAVRLQRASMPRTYFDEFAGIRPRTDLLRAGMRDDASRELRPFVNPSREEQEAPYFINEEEVAKAGVRVTSTFQRTRWYDGQIHSWFGRRKRVGRGGGSSGLAYDIVELVRKNKAAAE